MTAMKEKERETMGEGRVIDEFYYSSAEWNDPFALQIVLAALTTTIPSRLPPGEL